MKPNDKGFTRDDLNLELIKTLLEDAQEQENVEVNMDDDYAADIQDQLEVIYELIDRGV
jgi:hypothetical protein